jgi:hypothetical protein
VTLPQQRRTQLELQTPTLCSVRAVIPMVNHAVGQQLFSDWSLILTRHKTQQAPVHHVANGGNAWDTVKPLQKHFGGRIHRVVLVDDDAYKVHPSC